MTEDTEEIETKQFSYEDHTAFLQWLNDILSVPEPIESWKCVIDESLNKINSNIDDYDSNLATIETEEKENNINPHTRAKEYEILLERISKIERNADNDDECRKHIKKLLEKHQKTGGITKEIIHEEIDKYKQLREEDLAKLLVLYFGPHQSKLRKIPNHIRDFIAWRTQCQEYKTKIEQKIEQVEKRLKTNYARIWEVPEFVRREARSEEKRCKRDLWMLKIMLRDTTDRLLENEIAIVNLQSGVPGPLQPKYNVLQAITSIHKEKISQLAEELDEVESRIKDRDTIESKRKNLEKKAAEISAKMEKYRSFGFGGQNGVLKRFNCATARRSHGGDADDMERENAKLRKMNQDLTLKIVRLEQSLSCILASLNPPFFTAPQ